MDAHHLTALTDQLVDELSPGAAGDDSLLDRLENTRPGVDDTVVLNLIVAVVRLRNVLDYLLAFLIGLAERQRIPLRRKLKTGPDLLLVIGVAPVVAQRMGRLGRALHRFPTVAAGMRDGHTSAEFADAVVKGVEHIR
ncbi:MAG: HNH endonuclease, partial [Gordonia sp.]|nr:HNH endonuclease [Gordonia sp. (in: high G+C Gram-positive bacteria)]